MKKRKIKLTRKDLIKLKKNTNTNVSNIPVYFAMGCIMLGIVGIALTLILVFT